MTQAFNLALLGNKVNTSGSLNAATGLYNATPVANGGTGAATLAANNVLLGNGTSAVQAVAPSTSGNVLTSNGTTWTSAAPAVSTTAVLNATAGASAGSVGTYAIAASTANISVAFGSTISGGSLNSSMASSYNQNCSLWYAQQVGSYYSGALSGTWRCMGYIPGGYYPSTLWLRIS